MTWLCAVIGVLLAALVVTFMAWRNAARQRSDLRAKCAELAQTLRQVLERLSDMEQAVKLAADNRREADAKIEELHAGDAGGNALDVLSKPAAGGR